MTNRPPPARSFVRDNGLSLAVFGIFLLIWVAQALVGRAVYNDERAEHGVPPVGYGAYLVSGHFLEATAENWESEFLQMAAFVYATACLYQRGSPESNDPDAADGEPPLTERSPAWARAGGWRRALYSRSLASVLFALFLLSFVIHLLGGRVAYNEEQARLGLAGVSLAGFLGTSQFWFQSFQNWQSEFFSIGVMVVSSIWLRQKGSAESKAVNAPHDAHE